MYNDYPVKASNNAKEGYIKSMIKGTCNNATGMKTAEKLMNRDPLTEKFARKIHAYLERAIVYVGDENRCGYISYQLWGGKEMLQWCRKKLK